MTAVVEGVFIHPLGCLPCESGQQVGLSLIRWRDNVQVADSLSTVIDCPQCTNPDDLMQALPPKAQPFDGDDAA